MELILPEKKSNNLTYLIDPFVNLYNLFFYTTNNILNICYTYNKYVIFYNDNGCTYFYYIQYCIENNIRLKHNFIYKKNSSIL